MQVHPLADLPFATEQSGLAGNPDALATGNRFRGPTPIYEVSVFTHERSHPTKSRRIEGLQKNIGRPTLGGSRLRPCRDVEFSQM